MTDGRFLSEIADDVMGLFGNGPLSEQEIISKLKDEPEATRMAIKMLVRDGRLRIDLSVKTEYKLIPTSRGTSKGKEAAE